jgi:hypothetical protein|tara:strand:- start:33 stop:206 length:174 start_codon:yes stop_codon:yes gene_type:complete
MIKVKIMMTVAVDPEEYPIPADGRTGDEIESYIVDVMHELDGVTIKNIKSITEETIK